MGNAGISEAIVDTGPPLHLWEIGQVTLLSFFPILHFTHQIKKELVHHSVWSSVEKEKRLKIALHTISDNEVGLEHRRRHPSRLSNPDLSILALMQHLSEATVLTDDLELRQAVEYSRHGVVGSIGIVVRGYKRGNLSYEEMAAAVDRLLNDSSLYLRRAFKERILRLVRRLERGEKE
jgi:predicted nucleic acid-binding protein